MKNWYRNMYKGQKIFVWLVSLGLILAWGSGLALVVVLTYLELGERGEKIE